MVHTHANFIQKNTPQWFTAFSQIQSEILKFSHVRNSNTKSLLVDTQTDAEYRHTVNKGLQVILGSPGIS